MDLYFKNGTNNDNSICKAKQIFFNQKIATQKKLYTQIGAIATYLSRTNYEMYHFSFLN